MLAAVSFLFTQRKTSQFCSRFVDASYKAMEHFLIVVMEGRNVRYLIGGLIPINTDAT